MKDDRMDLSKGCCFVALSTTALWERFGYRIVRWGLELRFWVTHLSTAATIGDTVIAAARAVTASIRSLAGRFRVSTTGIVAIRSTGLTLMSCMPRNDAILMLLGSSTQLHKRYPKAVYVTGLMNPSKRYAIHLRRIRMLIRPEVVTSKCQTGSTSEAETCIRTQLRLGPHIFESYTELSWS